MKKSISLLYSLFGAAMFAAAAESVLPHLAVAPVIDGRVEQGEWRGARYSELKKMGGGAIVDKTEVYFGRDAQNLYVAFICHDRDWKGLRRAWRTPEERDNAVWNDDCVELRFDPWNAPDDLAVQRQIIVNSNGIVYDALGGDKRRDFSVRTQAVIGEGFWCVELAVPLTELTGYESGGAELWRLMLGRTNPRTREYSTLTGAKVAGFAKPEHFLTFRSAPTDPARPFTVTGWRDRKFLWRSENAAQPLEGELKQLRLDGKAVGHKLVGRLSPENPVNELAVTLHQDARVLCFSGPGSYRLEWDAPEPEAKSNLVRFTKKPLYKELWSKQAPGLGANGAMTWAHGFDCSIWSTALEFAFPWDMASELKLASDNRLWLLGAGGLVSPRWYNWTAVAPQGMKFVFTTQYYGYEAVPVPKAADGRPLLFDPRAEERWIKQIADFLKPYESWYYAVSFGDEITEDWERRFLELIGKHHGKGTYPYLDEVCETIRTQYGFGKFGPPESAADPNPYRWIALRSYLHDQSIRMQKRLKAVVNREMPSLKVIGDDPMAGQSRIYDFTDFTPDVCDIMTHQLYPLHSADLSDFSFSSKYVRDLAQVAELHPCFHIENYGAQYTPQEMLEKISQGFRGGATGFHWYLADTAGIRDGRSLGMDRYGAPERWQLLLALQKELRTLPPLNFPVADCGIFAPVTTARSYAGRNNQPQKMQMMHSLLELHTAAWFRYFNESSIRRGLVDLSRFKAVFVPDARYCPADALTALTDYARNGGTLVITDPEAFYCDASAAELDRGALPVLNGMTRREGDRSVRDGRTALALVKTSAWDLPAVPGAKTLLTYADGKPAAAAMPFGKGKVIVFGVNFAQRELTEREDWQKWFRGFVKTLGIQLDRDIWRFRFPEELIAPEPKPIAGRCLTGNHILFRNFRAYYGANDRVLSEADYRCTPAPDAPAEAVPVPIRRGKLTDRCRAYRSGNVDNKSATLNDRVVGWKTPGPIAIEFDLGKAAAPDRIEIFYLGAMRDVTVYTAGAGTEWRKAGFFPVNQDDFVRYGVKQKTLHLEQAIPDTTRVKLEFASTDHTGPVIPPGKRPQFLRLNPLLTPLPLTEANLMLAEIELWGK